MKEGALSQHVATHAETEPLSRAYLCLGANMGERDSTMRQALKLLEAEGIRLIARSGIYETPPWGPVVQGSYLNQVVAIETSLLPHELLHLTQRVERMLGRDRSREVRYGPRPIDIDILMLGDHSFCDEMLELPHPHIMNRAFVLVPLSEIDPDIMINGQKVSHIVGNINCNNINYHAMR